LKNIVKNLLYASLFVGGSFLFMVVAFWRFAAPHSYLPPEQVVRQQFETHRAGFIRFAVLLRDEKSARWVDRDGKVSVDAAHGRLVPEYGQLIREIGAKEVLIREDGSMEFELWGHGCAICDDSYMGVRYYPTNHKADSSADWTQTVVASLDSKNLPQHNGAVASGLYVVPIEPEWFIYRYEYQE
jgi:hypothetical protein